MPVQELATGPRGMAGTAALPPRQGGAGRPAGSRRKSERREGVANKVELEGQTGRGGTQIEGRYSLAGLEFRDRRDCMTPKVRFLDGVVCVLLCVGLDPCRLHVVLHKMSNLPDLQRSTDVADEGGDSINCSIAP